MIYWTMNSVPELKGLERREKAQLFRQAFKEGRSRLGGKQLAIRAAIYVAIIWFVFFVLWSRIQMLFAGPGLIGLLIMCAVIGGLVAVPAIFLIQTPIIDKGREWLREQGYPKS